MTVRGVIAAAIAATSGLLTAGCADHGATISGSVTSGWCCRAHCRAAWVARKMLSVPPDVRWPVGLHAPQAGEHASAGPGTARLAYRQIYP
jgi:hypothetical protein